MIQATDEYDGPISVSVDATIVMLLFQPPCDIVYFLCYSWGVKIMTCDS